MKKIYLIVIIHLSSGIVCFAFFLVQQSGTRFKIRHVIWLKHLRLYWTMNETCANTKILIYNEWKRKKASTVKRKS